MNKLKVTTAILLCVSILLFSATTYSWFKDGNAYGFPTDFGGSAMPAYFESGDGTEGDPYVISKPVHLYNLAWLQYLGYFNMREDFSNGNPQNYFKLTDNIDMRGRAVPPIGTAEYPFVGVFQGNGKTVKNVYIANKKGDDLLKVYPTKAVFDASGMLRFVDNSDEVSILGLFGVTGEYNGYVTEYAKAHTAFDSSKMKVSGFYADKLHVYSKSKQTLAGLLAGYVGCDFSNLGVYRCDMSFIPSATGIQSVTGDNSVVSLYSVVGAYNKDVVSWSDDKGTAGEGAGFGDSIDMRTITRRLTYMYAVGDRDYANVNSYGEVSFSDVYHTRLTAYIRDYYDTEYYWNSMVGGSVMYLNEGTIIPLSVDKSAMGLDTWDVTSDGNAKEKTVNVTYNNKTISYTTNQVYNGTTPETVSAKNTGYIVGDSSGYNSIVNIGRRKVVASSSDYYPGIKASIEDGTLPGNAYTKERIALYTYRNGAFYRIYDNVNNAKDKNFPIITVGYWSPVSYTPAGVISSEEFKRYDTVRANLDSVLEGTTVYNGLRFDAANTQAPIQTVSGVTTYTGALTDDQKYLEGGINFNVAQNGYVTTVLATTYDEDYASNLFDLYKVEKNADGTITGVTKIDKIYVKTEADGKEVVYYDDDPQKPADAQLVISLDELAKNRYLSPQALYYMEIPVSKGDYFIGSDKTSQTYSAYIIYLDIGANGSGETGGETGKPYTMDSIDFVNTSTVTVDENNVPVYTDYDAVFFKLSGVDGLTETPYVVFRRNEQLSADGKLKVVYTVISVAIAPSPEDLSAPGTLTPSLDDD